VIEDVQATPRQQDRKGDHTYEEYDTPGPRPGFGIATSFLADEEIVSQTRHSIHHYPTDSLSAFQMRRAISRLIEAD
jgi:hypothetical protein